MKIISIKEAVRKATDGKSLKDCTIDLATVPHVNVSDVLLLNEAGIVVPEERHHPVPADCGIW